MMNRMIKPALLLLALLLAVALGGCAQERNAYEENDMLGYSISVRFDANGGSFGTNTSVIVDSFKPDQLPRSEDGRLQLALLAPDDAARGNSNAFTATKSGCFLAGWYAGRTEEQDENGETVYRYTDPWDFSGDTLLLSADQTYSSQEPVLVLYAVWVPLFRVEFYDRADGTLLDTYTCDPTQGQTLQMPAWSEKTGRLDMHHFPQLAERTFTAAYYDEAGTRMVTGTSITHPGSVDAQTGTGRDGTLKLYLDYRQGQWFRIHTAEQFVQNASVTGCYELCADLDFTDQIWPTSFLYGSFSGTIQGNGHTMGGIHVAQTNNSKVSAGLFGSLTGEARLEDVSFADVSLTLRAGTRVAGASFGLLAGVISDDATLTGVSIRDGALYIDSGCYFGTSDYAIGLICGMGNADAVTAETIRCEATGAAPETVQIEISGNQVTVRIVTP